MLIDLEGVVQNGAVVARGRPDPRRAIRVQAGADVTIDVRVTDQNGAPVDATVGSFYLAIRSPFKEVKRIGLAVPSLGPNVVEFQIVSTETYQMGPGRYSYDVWRVRAVGPVQFQEAVVPTSQFIVEGAVYPFVAGPPTAPLPVPVPGGGGGSGWILVSSVTVPGGTVTDQVWEDAPANTILQSATVSDDEIEVQLRASYPTVMVGSTPATLALDVGGGFYEGSVAVIIGSGDLTCTVFTPDGVEGAVDTVTLTVDAPPNLTALSFTNGYPGAQTELKAGDFFDIQMTADKLFDRVEVLDVEAGISQVIVVPSGLTATVQIAIANRGNVAVARYARVRVRDIVTLAYGPTRDTNQGGGTTDGVDLVTLNNLHPSGAVSSIVYPVAQQAIKAVESAAVNHTAADYSTISYDDPTAPDQISIANPATFEAAKSVTALGLAVFNNSSPNFRYTMVRNANAAQTVVQGVVVIAGVAPNISVTLPAARLRSGGNNGTAAQDHTVTLSSNQPLLSAPSMSADSGGQRGTFLGVWASGPSVWTHLLRVNEAAPDEKGTFTFEGLVATGLAGLVQNTIGSGSAYTLGGFVSRTLSFAPFTATTSLGTAVTDFAKLQAGIFTQTTNPALKQSIGTSPPVVDGYTIDALNVNPTSLIWLDTLQVGANSTGLATITTVEETV